MRRLAVIAGLAVSAVAAAAMVLVAQEPPSKPPILHQDIAPPDPGEGRSGRPVFGPSPKEGQNPAAFGSGSKILPEPQSQERRQPAEPVHGRGGFAADRDTQTRPDYSTGPDSTLQYVTVFNPSVLPWKRMSALDSIDSSYRLYTADKNTRGDLTVGGQADSDRDLFWGSLVVELSPGKDVPIPSVAPDMRILSYETEPRISLRFSKDGADNFYVRSEESRAGGTYRLVFLADADSGYFAPRLPRRLRVSEVARYAPRHLIKDIPASVRRAARRAHRFLDIDTRTELNVALDKLTHYFRSFEAKAPPENRGNIYWDLFRSQAGVCRHRAFGFMVTANALGIPTRYITNEAHAFVEVWVPTSNWIRVDLGGAAQRMQVDNASNKSLHQPRSDDPFAKPDNYRNNYTQLEGDINGLTADQIAEGQQSSTGASTDDASADNMINFDPGAPETTDSGSLIGPDRNLATLPRSATADKIPTKIHITDVAAQGFRGETLQVSGLLEGGSGSDRKGIDGQRIDIWLAPRGRGGNEAQLVGRTVTSSDGTFYAQVQLPDDMPLMEYEVYASTNGDNRFAPTVSD